MASPYFSPWCAICVQQLLINDMFQKKTSSPNSKIQLLKEKEKGDMAVEKNFKFSLKSIPIQIKFLHSAIQSTTASRCLASLQLLLFWAFLPSVVSSFALDLEIRLICCCRLHFLARMHKSTRAVLFVVLPSAVSAAFLEKTDCRSVLFSTFFQCSHGTTQSVCPIGRTLDLHLPPRAVSFRLPHCGKSWCVSSRGSDIWFHHHFIAFSRFIAVTRLRKCISSTATRPSLMPRSRKFWRWRRPRDSRALVVVSRHRNLPKPNALVTPPFPLSSAALVWMFPPLVWFRQVSLLCINVDLYSLTR